MSRATTVLAALVTLAPAGYACDVVIIGGKGEPNVALEIVKGADLIVRATAVEYASPPERGKAPIRFKVLETIRGQSPAEVLLNGELVANDDFNSRPVPYQVVRSNGLAGTCYAWQYRAGEQYLLMLKTGASGAFTADWYALAPVNEQLHSAEDPWLLWVRRTANRR